LKPPIGTLQFGLHKQTKAAHARNREGFGSAPIAADHPPFGSSHAHKDLLRLTTRQCVWSPWIPAQGGRDPVWQSRPTA